MKKNRDSMVNRLKSNTTRGSSMGSKDFLAKNLTQKQISGSLNDLANGHEITRQNVIKQIFLYVFLMAKYKMLESPLTLSGATSQYFSETNVGISQKQDPHSYRQAAHPCPAQILYNGRVIHEYIPDKDLSLALENLFGETDGLPLIINQADSVAEKKGLREAFLHGCNAAASAGKFARFQFADEFAPQIENFFVIYRQHALEAFADAIGSQRNLMRNDTEVRMLEQHRDKVEILKLYAQNLRQAQESLDTVFGLIPNEILKDFQRVAKNSK